MFSDLGRDPLEGVSKIQVFSLYEIHGSTQESFLTLSFLKCQRSNHILQSSNGSKQKSHFHLWLIQRNSFFRFKVNHPYPVKENNNVVKIPSSSYKKNLAFLEFLIGGSCASFPLLLSPSPQGLNPTTTGKQTK